MECTLVDNEEKIIPAERALKHLWPALRLVYIA